jgi:sterol desaturase/sphingolipid hydroxylase (fatty acid hydroxylase superfamily)
MFENNLLEYFSRIHPATPFVVWVPVAVVFFVRSHEVHQLSWARAAAFAAAGLLVWTFAEYMLHRYVFHWVNDTVWGKRIHFLLHGVHHDFPSDKDRLVMPLLTSTPLAIVFYTLFTLAMGAGGVAFFSGFTVGYLCYDGTHYAVHHFKQTTRVGKFLRKHHMLHHHADHHGGFGVSSPLWDVVFGTMPRAKR